MKGKSIGIGAGVAAVAAVVIAISLLVKMNRQTNPPDEVVLSAEVVTLAPIATDEVLPTVVITLDTTDEVLPTEVFTLDTEPVIDIYTNASGCCLAALLSSSNIEYYGVYWTEETMKTHCAEPYTFSPEACPKESQVGGCLINSGTDQAYMLWFYDIGPDPITGETLPYAMGACEANGGIPVYP